MMAERTIFVASGFGAAILTALWAAAATGWLTGNATASVPRGLYLRADPDMAEYVSFCLAAQHRPAAWYGHFCSPDNPDGIRILKRIAARRGDGSLVVAGDSPRALDSRVLGPVAPGAVQGWWNLLVGIR